MSSSGVARSVAVAGGDGRPRGRTSGPARRPLLPSQVTQRQTKANGCTFAHLGAVLTLPAGLLHWRGGARSSGRGGPPPRPLARRVRGAGRGRPGRAGP